MRTLGTLIAGLLIILANAAFVYLVFPDTVIGRAVMWFLPPQLEEKSEASVALNRTFTCTEPLPEFTLGPMSDPSDQEVATLCGCIWSNLPSTAKEFATALKADDGSSPSDTNIELFSAHFGVAIRRCGG